MQKYFNYFKLDSCSLTFKVEDLKSYDKSIHDEWVLVNSSTGETMEGFTRKDYQMIERDGIRYDVKFYEIQNPKTLLKARYLNIIINSRHLHEKYFEGITDNNLFHLYSNIMDTGLIECSFQVFCNAKVSQPDFAIDSSATIEQVGLIYDQLHSVKADDAQLKAFKIGGQIHSYQFGMRKQGRKIMYSYKQPFFKLYSKFEDCHSSERKHVKEFYSKIGYVPNDLKDYYRFEMSIRDKNQLNKYLNKYSDEDYEMTLSGLCRMMENEEIMKAIRLDMLQKRLKKAVVMEEKKEEKVQLSDKLLMNIVEEVVSDSNMNISETVEYIMNTFLKGIGAPRTMRKYRAKVNVLVKTEMVKQMKELNKDGLVGMLIERGATELKGPKYDFNRVVAMLVL